MRKLIVACLLFGFLAVGSASTTSQEPEVPGPSNPYCDKKVSDFPMPEIICPDDGYYQVDLACAATATTLPELEACRKVGKLGGQSNGGEIGRQSIHND